MKVVKKKLIEYRNKLKYVFTESNLLIEVGLLSFSLTTLSLSKLLPPFKVRPRFTLFKYCPGGELYNLLAIKEKFSEEHYFLPYIEPSFTRHKSF